MQDILLVEDNELNRDMLSRRLERKGFSVRYAGDGAEAIERVKEAMPSIILMDMNLPVMNGWETCEALRRQYPDQKLPIIALTAHAMSGDREKALSAGCDDYATKPVDFKILLEKINKLLESSAVE